MIDIKKLTQYDIGRKVTYRTKNKIVEGLITSFNLSFVFVDYDNCGRGQATRAEDLQWVFEIDKDRKYSTVVFLQGDEADEPLKILNDKGMDDVFKYLQQWDMGEYNDETEESSKGGADYSHEEDGYLISWNPYIGYIGLEKIISGE